MRRTGRNEIDPSRSSSSRFGCAVHFQRGGWHFAFDAEPEFTGNQPRLGRRAIGFAIAGVPGAVLLGVATFFLSVLPVGPPLVWGGAAIWLFQQNQPGWAVFVAAWGLLLVSTVDNLIKPYIISRGSSLPFAIVLLGVLGGVLAFGVIGAFLGPTLLAVGYRLASEWTAAELEPPAEADPNDRPAA